MLNIPQPQDREKNYKLLPKCHWDATAPVTFVLYTESKEETMMNKPSVGR
jgi:hypothetical protein